MYFHDYDLLYINKVCLSTKNNKNSMIADVYNGRESEIDVITGYITKKANDMDILVPFNEKILLIIKRLEKNQRILE